MKARCTNPRNPSFKDYGGRGISVCERWKMSFTDFASDMGARPPSHLLDRKDNDWNYEPTNCRWATYTESVLNRRKTKPMLEAARANYALAVKASTAKRMARTHCANGHELTSSEIRLSDGTRCFQCARERRKRWTAKNPKYMSEYHKAHPDRRKSQ